MVLPLPATASMTTGPSSVTTRTKQELSTASVAQTSRSWTVGFHVGATQRSGSGCAHSVFIRAPSHGRRARLICLLDPLERSLTGLGRPTFYHHGNHDHACLLSGLDVTIGIGNRGERISAIDNRNEPARFDLVFQIVHKRLSASPLRQGNDDPSASRELRPKHEQQIL